MRFWISTLVQISSQMEMWSRNLDQGEIPLKPDPAEQALQVHNDTVIHLSNNVFQILQQGEQLAQVRGNFLSFR